MGAERVDDMELKVTTYEVDQGVALVTLNRPDRLNAWSARMETEYRWCLETADADPEVRVIVVTGAGRGFCAGADMRALDDMADAGAYPPDVEPSAAPASTAGRADFAHIHTFVLGLRKPVIAAVNGPAAGVGFVLMCFADIRFAAEGAKLTTSFGRLGLPAEHGVSWVLSRLIGPGRAADLLFSSRVVLGSEAAELGLVNRALPPDELMPFTLGYARRMAAEIAPSSLAMMKRQLWGDLLGDLDTAAARSVREMLAMIAAPDFAEGVAAFQERRPPGFAPLPINHPR
jgi:enoyl-CoA hydratase/carnithine racemase